ncbi:unnamed protein product [Ixodes pacificus]
MLEVIDNPNISNILYESFSLFGLSGLFSLTLETYPAHQRLGLGRVYGFKIGPPVFAFASELRAKQASSDSAVLASYEDSITAIAQTFRSGIPLQGIAREVVLLQHYLRQRCPPSQLEWYRLLVRIQERTTDRSHRNMSEPGSQVVTIWDKKYLHCINRLFKVEFNVRAVVNYLGWIIVERLGFLSYQRQLDAHRRTVYGYTDPTNVAETCSELVVQLAPQYSASLVFDAEKNRALIVMHLHTFLVFTYSQASSLIFVLPKIGANRTACIRTTAERRLQARPVDVVYTRDTGDLSLVFKVGETPVASRQSQPFLRPRCWDGTIKANLEFKKKTRLHNKGALADDGFSLLIPALLLPSENSLLGLPPIYAFSSLGGIIATKMMEIILFDGAYINDELVFEDWHSNRTKEKLDEVMNCFANDLDILSLQSQLLETDYIKLFQAVVCLSGGLSLTYKTYATFMGKYEEQFVESNMRNLKLTLHQYFFLQFARNLCRKYSDQYKKIFNLDDLEDKLRLIVPMRHSFRMARDFVCKESGQLNVVPQCSII